MLTHRHWAGNKIQKTRPKAFHPLEQAQGRQFKGDRVVFGW